MRRKIKRWLRRNRKVLFPALALVLALTALLCARWYVVHQHNQKSILSLGGETRGWDSLYPVSETEVWASLRFSDYAQLYYGQHDPLFDEVLTYDQGGLKDLELEDNAWLPPGVAECRVEQKPNRAGREAERKKETLALAPEPWAMDMHWRPLLMSSISAYKVDYRLYSLGIFPARHGEIGYFLQAGESDLRWVVAYCRDPDDPESPVIYYDGQALVVMRAVARIWGPALQRSMDEGSAQPMPVQPLTANLRALHFPVDMYFPKPDAVYIEPNK